MKSVGEAMAIGRSFPEALQKALRSIEKAGHSFDWEEGNLPNLMKLMQPPTENRLQQVQKALYLGATINEVTSVTKIDPWFLQQIQIINEMAKRLQIKGQPVS